MSLAERAGPMWRFWISDAYTRPAGIASIARTLSDPGPPAAAVANFWKPEQWSRLGDAVQELNWQRMLVLREGENVRAAAEAEFEAAPASARFSRHDRAVGIDRALDDPDAVSAPARQVLREFFAFSVLTPALATWVSEVLGCSTLKAATIEISRFGEGDFIAPHDDCVGERRCNLVSYLDPDYTEGDGGCLAVAGAGAAGEAVFRPCFNTAILLPIAPQNRHWVEPWRAATGRRAVSISFVGEN
jgi:hypothetical protein